MELTYILKIHCKQDKKENVTEIVDTFPSRNEFSYWELILTQKDSDAYVDFVNEFLNLLQGKYDALLEMGIKRDDIEIWILYKYDKQCNLKFSPKQMQRLGENGITLCISCWES